MHGKFSLEGKDYKDFPRIVVSCLGYEPDTIATDTLGYVVFLRRSGSELSEIAFTPDYAKIHRVLDQAVAHKLQNNPDRLDWYQCKVYYKMIVDAGRTDSLKNEQKAEDKKLREFLSNQHLMLSETYSRRTWRKPGQLQEDVLLNKFSGFNKTMFTSLVTDVLPFHAYADYLTINGKDYHNPVSKASGKYYKFNLKDELISGADTTWILSFFPLGHRANEMKGSVYIHSGSFAITNFVGDATDTLLHLTARMEQQYAETGGKAGPTVWFPKHLNYLIHWQQDVNGKKLQLDMKGSTDIDSVNFHEDEAFKFDKGHTMRIAATAAYADDSALRLIRPAPLDAKERRSYQIIDSVGKKAELDKKMSFFAHSADWKFPVFCFDLDARKLIAYNDKEGLRLGAGIQTNDRVSKWFSVGGYGGYGFMDNQTKFGVFGELYFDRYKEFSLHGEYSDDVADPGRVQLFDDIDKNYLNSYLLWRTDRKRSYLVSLHKKTGFWSWQLSASRDFLQPQYNYQFVSGGHAYAAYNDKQADLRVRYAFGETTAPFFNTYYSLGTKYPVCYLKVTCGVLDSGSLHTPYTQLTGAVVWNKHLNRIGYEHIRVEGGVSLCDGPLPLSKIFAANGYNYVMTGANPSIYTLGGMMTMTPYQGYSDRFVNLIFRHDLDWKLFSLESARTVYSSRPRPCLQYNLLLGGLAHRDAHQGIEFLVPDAPYQEIGMLLKDLLRIRYAGLYYLTFDYGCFLHATAHPDAGKDTRMVFGVGLDL